jgi:YidC/Oxa1 family membrane protein insertase
MQDQGKRLLLAVGLALVVMVVWNQFISPPPPQKPAPTQAGQPGKDGAAVPSSAVARSQVGTGTDGRVVVSPKPTAEQTKPEQKIELSFERIAVEFSNRDAALVSWRLLDSKYLRDPLLGQMVAPGRGLLLVNFARSTHVLPKGAMWQGEQLSPTQVRYRYRTDAIEVVKTFTVHPDSFLVALTVQVSALAGDSVQRVAITSFGYQDPRAKVESQEQTRAFMSATLANGEISQTPHKSLAQAPRAFGNFRWTGFDHPYLLVAMSPNPKVPNVEKFTAVTGEPGGIETDVLFPAVTMRGGDQPTFVELVTYIGPKHYSELEAADKVAGFATGFKETVDLGWFKIIGRPLLSLLQFLEGLFGNWGIAIILLTVLVKAATLYWTTKSMRSMKAMAVLAPKMKELKDKYGSDNAKLQQETMALYKHHGVNPLAGCLPILLQMPIWIALYRMLSSASELYLQPLIGGWIGDLTSRDPLYILPVAVAVTQFLQMKLQPVTGDNMQQKIMMYGMPLIFGVMGLYFPSGLTLYMFTNALLSALHSLYMNKLDKPSLAMAAKLEKGKGKLNDESPEPVVATATSAVSSGDEESPSPPSKKTSPPSKKTLAARGNGNSNHKKQHKR